MNEEAAFLQQVEAQSLAFLWEEPYIHWNEILKQRLSPHRYRHVCSVTKTAIVLARRYQVSVDQARTAAFLHDCAKHNEKYYFACLLEKGVVHEQDFVPSPYFHAFLGGLVAWHLYGVHDEAVVQAIQSHTLGSEEMSPLDQVIFLADLIEPGRDFPDLAILQRTAMKSLEEGVLKAFDNTLLYLIAKGAWIHPEALFARNAILKKVQKGRSNS